MKIAVPKDFPRELLQPIRAKFGNRLLDNHFSTREFAFRVMRLASHYGISDGDPEFFMRILIQLLPQWIPGFRESQAGRKKDRNLAQKRERLLLALENLKTHKAGLKDRQACALIAGYGAEGVREFRNVPVETLRGYARIARRERKSKMRAIGALLQRQGALGQ